MKKKTHLACNIRRKCCRSCCQTGQVLFVPCLLEGTGVQRGLRPPMYSTPSLNPDLYKMTFFYFFSKSSSPRNSSLGGGFTAWVEKKPKQVWPCSPLSQHLLSPQGAFWDDGGNQKITRSSRSSWGVENNNNNNTNMFAVDILLKHIRCDHCVRWKRTWTPSRESEGPSCWKDRVM